MLVAESCPQRTHSESGSWIQNQTQDFDRNFRMEKKARSKLFLDLYEGRSTAPCIYLDEAALD
jgi:hypothetical protein